MATSSFYNSSGSTPTQATDIATSVDQAQDAAQEAEATLNEFKTLYMGIYSTAPVASQTGSLYYNDTTHLLYYWNGTNWTATNTSVADTDGLPEGSTNQYFTAERVDDQVNTLLTAGSNVTLTYDDAAGSLTIASTGGGSTLTDTDDLTEGSSNLYFTNARVDARISTSDTDALAEGYSNLYFTDERVDDRVNSLLTAGSNITLTYDDAANTLTIASTASGGSTLTDTDDLTEGTTNLYYTDARADARIAAAGHITASSTDTLTNKSGNISQWTNDSNYLTGITGQSLYSLSNVYTSSSPSDGQVLTWDNANSYWKPTTSSGSGATTLSGLNDVSPATPANGQVLTWDNSTSLWQPVNPSGGIALTDLSASNGLSGNASLSYNNSTGQFVFTPPDLTSYLQNINSESLADLSDVNNATPTDGQVLTWDNANSYWKPSTVSSGGGSSQSPNIVTGTYTTTSTSFVDAGEIVDTDDGFTGAFEVLVSAQVGTGNNASAWYGKLNVAYNKEAPSSTNWMTNPWFGNGFNSGSSGHNISAIRLQPRWDTSTNKIYLQVKNGSSTSTVYTWTATLI